MVRCNDEKYFLSLAPSCFEQKLFDSFHARTSSIFPSLSEGWGLPGKLDQNIFLARRRAISCADELTQEL
jgi:hypothetical protein